MSKHARNVTCLGSMLAMLIALSMAGSGCRRSSTGKSNPLPLFVVSFSQNQATSVYRDEALAFELSAAVDPASVDFDTIQVLELPNRTPVLGLFDVQGNRVSFTAVVDEGAPNPRNLPLNPYGFAAGGQYEVVISDTGMKTLRGAFGQTLESAFAGTFATQSAFTPQPNAPDPLFEPFDAAVFDTTNPPYSPANPKGTAEPADDVLRYSPFPTSPATNPNTNRLDYRVEKPTDVRVDLACSRVIDPRSVNTGFGGNLILEYRAGTEWLFVASVAAVGPNGKIIQVTAASPLANGARINRYRLRYDPAVQPIVSRGGKTLLAAVDVWDDTSKRVVRRSVDEAALSFWTRVQVGESGPFISFAFPLETFVGDPGVSDADVTFGSGKIEAGPVVTRTAEDTTNCNLPGPACNLALREPLTQSRTASAPNPNSKGPSKIQFHFNSFQHAPTLPSWRLPDAEALTQLSWRPHQGVVARATYPDLKIELASTPRDSRTPNNPASLISTTYAANLGATQPTLVRDGPYSIPLSRMTQWQSWDLERPFVDYRTDRGLIMTAWTDVGGDVEQYFSWYSPNALPNTRLFSAPSTVSNPQVGAVGQWTYYHTRFEFKRMRSVAATKYYRVASQGQPQFRRAVVSPSRSMLPAGSDYVIEFSGATFPNYVQRTIGSRVYWEGVGAPTQMTAFSSDVTRLSGFPAVAARVVFSANVDTPQALPFVDGLAFTFEIR